MVRLIGWVQALFVGLAFSASCVASTTSPPVDLTSDGACAGIRTDAVRDGREQSALDTLLRLRDIGFAHLADLDRVMSVSPDGRLVALVLSQGDPASNAYCQVVTVVPTDGSGRLSFLDTVGQPDVSRGVMRGLWSPSGLPAQNVPRWSADGQWLAYLKRIGSLSEAWRVNVRTGIRERLSAPGIDVERLGWLSDKSLAIGFRSGRVAAASALEREGRSGYLFDDRFAIYTGNKPLQRADLPLTFEAIEVESGTSRPLTENEGASVGAPRILDTAARVLLSSAGQAGQRAWTAQEEEADWTSPVRLWFQTASGQRYRCEQQECIGTTVRHFITNLWLAPDGRAVYWMKRTGWGDGDTALYRWQPNGRVEKVLQTSDLLIDCQTSIAGIFCVHEASRSPRTIVRVDEKTGRWRTVWDPNPNWQAIELGSVQRLHWRNNLGFEVFGDLVLPPDYRPGTRLPLIVVQYTSRGLLRGGTGDEYPIFPFAERGYAVLSFNMPPFYNSMLANAHWPTPAVAEKENVRDWRQRWSVLSALENGVRLVVDRGFADPNALGITGLSDGSTTAQMALVQHPTLFKAASVSACCLEPDVMMIFGGTALSDERRAWGFPWATDAERSRWAPLSLSLHPEIVQTPMLISNGDNEILLGVEPFMALRRANKPVEMYIYPDEYHLKIQPAHKLALYRRNLAWFDFWLRQTEDTCLASEEEFKRWRKMPGAPASENVGHTGPSCSP